MLGVRPKGGEGLSPGVTTPREEEGPIAYPTAKAGKLGGCIRLGGGWMHPHVPLARREEEGRGKPRCQSTLP
jgi:hypothetical protein